MTQYNKAYPLLPQVAYEKTLVPMQEIIDYIKTLQVPLEVKRATYVIGRNESANGQDGIGNNLIGMQSDGDAFPQKYNRYIVAYCVKNENLTGKARGFLCFDKWQSSFDILADEIATRGLYIGGKINSPYVSFTDVTEANFCQAYEDLWVYGNKDYKPTAIEISDFNSMYSQAKHLFV